MLRDCGIFPGYFHLYFAQILFNYIRCIQQFYLHVYNHLVNETICMKCQILFSGKIKKKISKCHLLIFFYPAYILLTLLVLFHFDWNVNMKHKALVYVHM